jgi:HTH-type transcriptional regulator/antitoxin HigA
MLDKTALQAERAWLSVAKILYVPHNEAACERLIDQIDNDETHPLASLMEVIGVLVEKYEDEHVPELEE